MPKILALAALALLLSTSGASAHAFLDHASPPVGSTVRVAPAELLLWFTEDLEPAFTTVAVTNKAGARFDQAGASVDPGNHKLLHVKLKATAPGAYLVNWHALSVDTHKTDGSFSFSVGGP